VYVVSLSGTVYVVSLSSLIVQFQKISISLLQNGMEFLEGEEGGSVRSKYLRNI